MQTIYEAAGGSEGMLRLAGAWHKRVLEDEIVSHAFSHGFHPQHTERLAAYWGEALGGPATYSDQYGSETSVVRMHSGNGPHEEMDQRAIACFDQALEDVGITNEPLRKVLHDYFAWATTTTMARYHDSEDDVPDGLLVPKWSWHGLVYDDDYPTCKATYATLRIYHDELDPDEISSRLGLTPSKAQKKGQVLGPNRLAPLGGWFLCSRDLVVSKDVRRHVAWILDHLEGREEQFLKLQDEGYDTDISCYWLSAHGHGGPELDPELMQRLVSLRLLIGFDVY